MAAITPSSYSNRFLSFFHEDKSTAILKVHNLASTCLFLGVSASDPEAKVELLIESCLHAAQLIVTENSPSFVRGVLGFMQAARIDFYRERFFAGNAPFEAPISIGFMANHLLSFNYTLKSFFNEQ
jgi:hypothetical protein